MLKKLFIAVIFLPTVLLEAQQTVVADSIKAQLARTASAQERVDLLGILSRIYMNTNLATADSLGKKMIEEAEISRDRKLIVKALLTNGERNSYFASKKENLDKAISFYLQALDVAKQNKLDEEIAQSFLSLSSIYRAATDADKAFSYCNQAFSYISILDNDSLKVSGYLEYGAVYNLKREKLLALRNYLAGLRIAEVIKNVKLMRQCYLSLTNFYASIEDYDKAIDYQTKAIHLLDQIKEGQSIYNKVVDVIAVGNLYARKKNYDMATYYFESSLRLADSLRYEPLKMPAYMGILNNYLLSDKPREALNYFNKNTDVRQYVTKLGMGSAIDMAYGYIYTDLGKYDSAVYYYKKSAPFFENSSNDANRYTYYYRVGRLYKLSGDNKKAIEYLIKTKEVADKIADPERIRDVARELDSAYLQAGDYRQSQFYSSMYYQYKDSLDKLGKEKDLLQVEAADEHARQERLVKEEAEIVAKRHRIQYMAITIGIVALFVLLVMMGMFRVSATTIKMIGFFTFLMFFEFIFLIFKKNIHSVTGDEPWKDLLFMIALAAILLPLHHWLEEKVIRYLTSHNRLTAAGKHLKLKLFSRKKSEAQ